MVADSNELLGQALGTCTLQRLIGRGGMGAVYLARQSRPRRTVAVKVLMPGLGLDKRSHAEFLARFRREADAIAALDHINIMPIYEYGEQEHLAYLVMPYVIGGTLRELLETRERLPLEEAISITEQAAAALDSAHAQGIIHRDLKPGNILFHADGRILLADFGLAKVIRDLTEQDHSKNSSAPLTSLGTIVGTPEYLSPEQATGKTIDHRTDIYSLGIVLYQMLAGRVPFTGPSPVAVAIKHTLEDATPLRQLNSAISTQVEAVVMKALAKDPDQRFASAGEWARALRAAKLGKYQIPVERQTSDIRTDTPIEQIVLASSAIAPETPTAEDIHDAPTEEHQPVSPVQHDMDDLPTLMVDPNDAESQLEKQGDLISPLNIEALPTMLVVSNEPVEDDVHNAQTEATPRITQADEKKAKGKPKAVRLSKDAVIEETPRTVATKQEDAQRKGTNTQEPPLQKGGRQIQQRGGSHPIWMMLLGSFLTLVIVIVALASYLNLMPPPFTNTPTKTATTAVKATATPTQKPTSTNTQLPPAQIAAGKLIYGTSLPGQDCDTLGGRWTKTTNIQISCEKDGVRLKNGSGNLATTTLDGLSEGKAVPKNYVIQLQVMPQNAKGKLGILFRKQPGSQKAYSFWLDPQARLCGDYVYNESGATIQQGTYSLSTQVAPDKPITVNIIVQDNSFTYYVNGGHQGYRVNSSYTDGAIGLAVEGGADILVKNFAIYELA